VTQRGGSEPQRASGISRTRVARGQDPGQSVRWAAAGASHRSEQDESAPMPRRRTLGSNAQRVLLTAHCPALGSRSRLQASPLGRPGGLVPLRGKSPTSARWPSPLDWSEREASTARPALPPRCAGLRARPRRRGGRRSYTPTRSRLRLPPDTGARDGRRPARGRRSLPWTGRWRMCSATSVSPTSDGRSCTGTPGRG